MKKQYTIIAMFFVITAVLTGCSWSDIKSKFTGEDAASGSAVTTGPVIIEAYNVEDCVEVKDYKGIEIDCTVSDEDIQEAIDEQLSQHVKEIKQGTVASGTSINIDFTGKIDGKKFDGGSAEDYEVVAGNSGFIEGFDEGMIGMKVGETKDLNLKFPDSYPNNPDLQGKDVVFTVKVNHIVETQRRTFNDAFVKKYIDGYKTVSEFKKGKRKELQEEKISEASSQALGIVMQNATYKKVPETLKQAYHKYYDQYMRLSIKNSYGESVDFETALAQQGLNSETYEQQLEMLGENYAKQQLVCEYIAKKENISITDEDVKKFITDNNSGVDFETLKSNYNNSYGEDAAMTFEQMNKTYYLITKTMEVLEKNLKIKK